MGHGFLSNKVFVIARKYTTRADEGGDGGY
jgi:hypothetical protein